MDPKAPAPQPTLEESLRRMRDAVARGEATHAQLLKSVVTAVGVEALDRASERMVRRLERKRQRQERRRLRRERLAQTAVPRAIFGGVAAIVLLGLAVAQPHLWWLVFVALGLGSGGVSALLQARRHPALGAGDSANTVAADSSAVAPPTAVAVDPLVAAIDARLARVEDVSQKLLADLAAAPAAVREFAQRPDETVTALVTACRELSRRERELRALVAPGDDTRLRDERKGLEARIAAAPDDVVRGRFTAALQSLDGQLAQRAQLVVAADRFEAESTRILYSLENLRTQVLRARSADAASPDVVGAGLRRSLEQLGEELDAIAEALESESRGPELRPAAVVDVAGPSAPSAPLDARIKTS